MLCNALNMKHPGDHDDDRWHQVEQLKEKLEASLSVGFRIETEDHNIVVGSHLPVEVRLFLMKVLVTIMGAKQVYHSSLKVEFSNFANQSVGDIPKVLKSAVYSKDEKSENERSETVDKGDITEEKC